MPIRNNTHGGSTGAAIKGLETKVEFNGLTLNDRYASTNDIYRLTGIDGLDNPDVRDLREIRPQSHGEIAYDAYYGGRTITLTGRIEAGNLNRLREMQQNLRNAFQSLEESKMLFRYYDVYEDFSRADAEEMFTWVSNSKDNTTLSNGMLFSNLSATPHIIYRSQENRKYNSAKVVIKFKVGNASTNGDRICSVLKFVDTQNYCMVGVDPSNNSIILTEVLNNVPTEYPLYTGAAPLTPNVTYWLSSQMVDNTVYCELSQTDATNRTIGDPSANTYSRSLSTNGITALGDGVPGNTGMYVIAQAAATGFTIKSWETRGINPNDICVFVRKSSSIQMKETQNNTAFHRDFMITCRASNPSLLSNVRLAKRTIPAGGTNYGRIYEFNGVASGYFNRIYNSRLDANSQYPQTITSSLNITNRGSFDASPTIRIYGACSYVAIENITNSTSIVINGSVTAGDYIDIDIANKTVKNGAGNNAFGLVSPTSDWITLSPGDNAISVAVSSLDANAYTYVFWNDTWI